MKKYLTPHNIAIAVLSLGVIILVIVIFFSHNSNGAAEQQLQEQAKQLQQLEKQLEENTLASKKQDSILKAHYLVDSTDAANKVSNFKKQTNDKINSINSDSYNADSIQRWFANN